MKSDVVNETIEGLKEETGQEKIREATRGKELRRAISYIKPY